MFNNNERQPLWTMWGRRYPAESGGEGGGVLRDAPSSGHEDITEQPQMWGYEEPTREPFFRAPSLAETVRQVAAELIAVRQTADAIATYGNLARIVPFVYGQARADSSNLMALILDHPESFTAEGLRKLREASHDKFTSLPAQRRAFECAAETRSRGDRVVSFTASTASLDRHGTRVRPEGIDTNNYERNPIFAWAHDAYGGWSGTPDLSNVIGRTVRIRKSSAALEVDVEFLDAATNPRAEQALRMVRAKALNSVSIGFIPHEVITNIEDGREVPTILRSELLEISLVAIPSNPDALATSRAS